MATTTRRIPPPQLAPFRISVDSSTPEIAIEQVFKAGPTWGISLDTIQNRPSSSSITNNNNGNIPEDENVTFQRQRINEWRATCQTDPNAAHNLGIAYFRGEMGVRRDYVESVKLFKMAAEKGNINSAFNLGWQYTNGTGVRQSWPNAIRWWKMASELGHSSASRNVGLLYSLGIADGGVVNHEMAVHYYKLACSQGNCRAHFALANCYKSGLGVAVDLIEADRLEKVGEALKAQQQTGETEESLK